MLLLYSPVTGMTGNESLDQVIAVKYLYLILKSVSHLFVVVAWLPQ